MQDLDGEIGLCEPRKARAAGETGTGRLHRWPKRGHRERRRCGLGEKLVSGRTGKGAWVGWQGADSLREDAGSRGDTGSGRNCSLQGRRRLQGQSERGRQERKGRWAQGGTGLFEDNGVGKGNDVGTVNLGEGVTVSARFLG